MRGPLAVAGGALVAAGGAVCAGSWTVGVLADSSTTVDRSFVAFALGGLAVALGAATGFAVLPVPWNLRAGGIAAAALFAVGALTMLAVVGFVIAPLGLLCLAAAAHAAGRPVRMGALLLAASVAVYAGGAWALESAGEDGAYAVIGFAPLFGLAWVVLGYAIARAVRPQPPSASP